MWVGVMASGLTMGGCCGLRLTTKALPGCEKHILLFVICNKLLRLSKVSPLGTCPLGAKEVNIQMFVPKQCTHLEVSITAFLPLKALLGLDLD